MKKIGLLAVSLVTVAIVYAQPPNVPADKGASFGEAVTVENAITVEQLVTDMNAKKEGQKKTEVKLKATVTDVCTKEGCWIRVASPNGKIFVRMKDHKFLVPLAMNGKDVVIDGIADEKITTVEQLRHFAEDAGKSKEEIAAITEPKKEIVLQAKGIVVL